MKRRTLLHASLCSLTTLSGCISGEVMGSESRKRYISIESSRDVQIPGTTMSVEVVSEEITRKSAGRIQITLTNEGESETNYICGFRPPFSALVHTGQYDEEIAWYLFHPTKHTFTEQDYHQPNNCWWSIEREVSKFSIAKLIKLGPSDSIAVELDTVANGNREDCMPTGRFQFDHSYNDTGDDWAGREFEWGFTLEVTRD